MTRFRLLVAVLLTVLVSACGSTPAATPAESSAAVASAPADAAASALPLPSEAADILATAQALANDPTALAELQATILAQKPTTDGCDPSMQNLNAERADLEATWTADNQINLKGEVDVPADASFFVFVYNNGAPIYWANFPEITPSGKSWDFTTTTPAPDDMVMGELSRENPYTPDSKICVGVTALSADMDLSDLSDVSKMREAVLLQLKLPVGGTAPSAIVMPTANPAGGEGICTDSAELPIAKFKDVAPLAAGAYADALAGAQAWQSDARLYEMRVSCAIMGDLRWEFRWASESAQQVGFNSAREPEVAPDSGQAIDYESVAERDTIDPTGVATTIDKLGDALVAAGYQPTQVVGILGGISLGEATSDDFSFQTPEGANDGIYYRLPIQVNPDDLGEQVMVDATSGEVYKLQ